MGLSPGNTKMSPVLRKNWHSYLLLEGSTAIIEKNDTLPMSYPLPFSIMNAI